jgi:hypothetical protein
MKVVCSGQLQLGSVYGASEPLTWPPVTRTKLMVRVWELGGGTGAAGDCAARAPAANCGDMTTSPDAESVPDVRLNRMLPLRPVSALQYSPVHSPARLEMSDWAPTTGTGVWLPLHANHATAIIERKGARTVMMKLLGSRLVVPLRRFGIS